VIDCKTCKVPMAVSNQHVLSLTREQWGRMLYICRRIFGSNIRLKANMRQIRDHIHHHIILPKGY
jgi:hypothetical protein